MSSALSERSTFKQLLFVFLGMSLNLVIFLSGVQTPRQSIFQPNEPVANSQSPALWRISVGIVHIMHAPAFVLVTSLWFLFMAWRHRAERQSWIFAIVAGIGLPTAFRMIFLGRGA